MSNRAPKPEKPPREGEPRSFAVTLHLPPKDLSPNGRCHWAVKARATANYRAVCREMFREQRIPPLRWPVVVHSEWFLDRGNDDGKRWWRSSLYFPKDQGNATAALKAALDGMVDAGVVPNDSQVYVRQGRCVLYTRAKEHGGRAEVRLTIEEVE